MLLEACVCVSNPTAKTHFSREKKLLALSRNVRREIREPLTSPMPR